MIDNPRQDHDNKLPRVDVGGRFLSAYSPEIALQIIERLAEGETLTAICRGQPGMPHPKTFRRWMVNNPDLAKAYQVAIQVSATSLEEEALEAARSIAAKHKDGTHVRATEVKLQQLRWSAERRDPNKYGNKSQVSVKVPIQIITPLDLGGPSTDQIQDIYTIEAKALKSPDEAAQEAKSSEQLVPEKAIRRGYSTPFSRMMERRREKAANVRQAGSAGGNREEHLGSGGAELPRRSDEASSEAGETHAEGGQSSPSGGEGDGSAGNAE